MGGRRKAVITPAFGNRRADRAMTVDAKICGLNTTETVAAAVTGGARYVGFVFYPPSPRSIDAPRAAQLATGVPVGVTKVGLFVDPDDAYIAEMTGAAALDLLQLHGAESPERVAAIRDRFGLAVMKAIKVAEPADIDAAHTYEPVADRLLFDAKAPKSMRSALPGGNALVFDWQLLRGARWRLPWMLSGGLDSGNVAEAVQISGASAVDVSSGVESSPGHKDCTRIAAFLNAVAEI